jgi:hypothetical protein
MLIVSLAMLSILSGCERHESSQNLLLGKTMIDIEYRTEVFHSQHAWAIPFGHQIKDTTLNYFSYTGQQTVQIITVEGEHIGVLTLSETDNIGLVDFEVSLLPKWRLSGEKDAIQVQSFNLAPLENEQYQFDSHKGKSEKFQLFEAASYSIVVKTIQVDNPPSTASI